MPQLALGARTAVRVVPSLLLYNCTPKRYQYVALALTVATCDCTEFLQHAELSRTGAGWARRHCWRSHAALHLAVSRPGVLSSAFGKHLLYLLCTCGLFPQEPVTNNLLPDAPVTECST